MIFHQIIKSQKKPRSIRIKSNEPQNISINIANAQSGFVAKQNWVKLFVRLSAVATWHNTSLFELLTHRVCPSL